MTIIASPQFDLIYIPVLILCTGLFVFSGLRQKYPVATVAAKQPSPVRSCSFGLEFFADTGLFRILFPAGSYSAFNSGCDYPSFSEKHHTSPQVLNSRNFISDHCSYEPEKY